MRWMRTKPIVLAAVSAFLLCNLQAALGENAPARLAVPGAAEQMAALKLIHELFSAEYARRAPADRAFLATKLMEAAADSGDDPASQYVLLREARENAVSASDPDIALAAVDALGSRFEVDAPALLVETLTGLDRQSQSPEVALGVTDAAMDAIEKGASANDFGMLARLSPVVESAAGKMHLPELKKRLEARLRQLKESGEAYESVERAKRLLVTQPNNSQAHTVVGKYLWLQKNDWLGAMPHFSVGSDEALNALALVDQSVPPSATAAVAAARGDAWWLYAGKQTGLIKVRAEQRAADWYRRASAGLAGPKKVNADKRIELAAADYKTYAATHETGPVFDAALSKSRRDSIEKAPTYPLDGQTLKGIVTIPRRVIPYRIPGTLKFNEAGATITVLGGTEFRGGALDLGGKGHLIVAGSNGNPAVFRHVVFLQDLGGSFVADGAVFDDCTFKKWGPWFSNYSSKWTFTSCVLHNCRFGGLTEVDYGFKIRGCVLVSTDLPEIKHPHKGDFNHVTALHQEWNTITGCTFVDCAVPPTVCWCAESSNFLGCKFISGEPFESDKPWDKIAYIADTIGPTPQRGWADDMPKRGAVNLINAAVPFPTISLSGMDRLIPELVIGNSGASVITRHLK